MALIKNKLKEDNLQIKCECLKAFNKLVRLLKSNSFSNQWKEFYEIAWSNLQQAQSYIEKIGVAEESSPAAEENDSRSIFVEEVKLDFGNGPTK